MKVGTLWIELNTKLDAFNRGMSDAERAMVRVGQKFTAVGKKLTMMVTLPILAVGAAAVKMGADFEQSMMNAASVSGATGEELKRMEGIAREMGETTVFSAKQSADAMYFMASAGWKVNDMGKAIKPTLDLAAATQSDLAFTTDTVVASLNQFQLGSGGAKRVTNVFAAAISNSQATLEKLSTSMTYVGPIFNSMGKSVEEAAATLMVLYNAGYEASMAGTALRMGIARLLKPTSEAQKTLAKLGLTIEDIDPTTKHFADIIEILGERGATTKNIIEIFGVRAGPAFAALLSQGSDAIRDFEKEITGTNAAAKMAEMQINTLKGSFKLLTSALTEAAIQIFKILGPGIKDLVDNKLKPAVLWFNKLSEGTKKTIITVAGLAAAAGPLLLIFGKLLVILPKIKVALAALSGPIGIVIGGLAIIASRIPGIIADFKNMGKSVYDFEKETENAIVPLRAFWKAIKDSTLHSNEFANAIQRNHGDVTKVMKKLADGTLKHAKNLQLAYNYVEKNAEAAKKAAEDAAIAEGKLNRITNATKAAQSGLRESYTILSRGVKVYVDNLIEVAKIKGTLTEERKKELEKMREELTNQDLIYKAYNKVITALREKANLTPKLISQLEKRKTALEALIDAQKENFDETTRIIPKIKDEKTEIENLESKYWDLMAKVFKGEAAWQTFINQAVELKGKISALKDEFSDLDMAIEDDAEEWIDFGDTTNTVLEDMGYGLGSIPDKAEEATKKTKSAWDKMADGLQTKWASTIGEVLRGATSLKDGLKGIWDSVVVQFTDMIGQMIAKWTAKFVSNVLTSITDIGKKITDGIGGAATGAADIITTTGTAATSLLSTIGALGILALGVAAIFNALKPSVNLDYTNRLLEDLVWKKQNAICRKLDSANVLLDRIAVRLKKLQGASSGVVITSPQLVMAHGTPSEPEYIIPSKNLSSLALSPSFSQGTNLNTGATMNNIVNIYAQKLDDYTINTAAEKIFAAVERQEARRGGR